MPSSSMAKENPLETMLVIDLTRFLETRESAGNDALEDCIAVKECLCKYGIAIIKDPRVPDDDNEKFIDMMEKYYEQPHERKMEDVRPDLSYQVGATPSNIERARNHCSAAANMPEDDRPVTICPPGADPKWRYFWRIGERPKETDFGSLNAEDVTPSKERFPMWTETMNNWGNLMQNAVESVAEMAAVGLGCDQNLFVSRMKNGPHLLAPTGSDLQKFSELKTTFASFHYDLNFLTIHGRSRFPGLFVWLRDGRRVIVRVPKNCLLVQAGKQFEWLTGGRILAGFHEVVVCPETIEAMDKAKNEGRSLWRVSSTLFAHIASDTILEPLEPFASEEAKAKYPSMKAGEQVRMELDAIKLSQ